MRHVTSWRGGLGIGRHRWMVHHILLVLLILLILKSQRDIGEILGDPFWSSQTVLDVTLLTLSLLLQSLRSGYSWAWHVTLVDRIIEEGNQTDQLEENEERLEVTAVFDKVPEPCTADQGQIKLRAAAGCCGLPRAGGVSAIE